MGFRQFANILRFWGGFKNFPLKNFSHKVDLEGVRTELLNLEGSKDGIGRKWGGGHYLAPEGRRFRTSPPLGVYDTFP